MGAYAAVVVPAEIGRIIQEVARHAAVGFPYDADKYHLTLRHFGDVDADDAEERLLSVRHGPVEIRLNRIGQLSHAGVRYSCLLAARTRGLVDLARRIDRQFPRLPRQYPFRPHVTLGFDGLESVLGRTIRFTSAEFGLHVSGEGRNVLQRTYPLI